MSILNALAIDTKRVTNEGLKRLNLVVGGLYLLQAIGLFLLSGSINNKSSVITGLLSNDGLASDTQGKPYLAHASHHLFDINIIYILSLSLLIAAGAHILLATRRRKNYESNLKKSANAYRWIQVILAGGVLALGLALAVGITELSLLVLIFGALAIFSLSAYSAESNPAGSKTNKRLGATALLISFITLLIYLWGSYVYGSTPNIYVYVASAVLTVYFGSLYVLNPSAGTARTSANKYLMGERNHILVSLLATSAVAWALFLALSA